MNIFRPMVCGIALAVTAGCSGISSVTSPLPETSKSLSLSTSQRAASVSANVRFATAQEIRARQLELSADTRAMHVRAAPPGNSQGCTGACSKASYTVGSSGTTFFVTNWAPNPGTYQITGYTIDNAGNQTPINSFNVSVPSAPPEQLQTVSATVYVPSNTDMANGIVINITGPNNNSNSFDPGADTGSGSWNYSPWDAANTPDPQPGVPPKPGGTPTKPQKN